MFDLVFRSAIHTHFNTFPKLPPLSSNYRLSISHSIQYLSLSIKKSNQTNFWLYSFLLLSLYPLLHNYSSRFDHFVYRLFRFPTAGNLYIALIHCSIQSVIVTSFFLNMMQLFQSRLTLVNRSMEMLFYFGSCRLQSNCTAYPSRTDLTMLFCWSVTNGSSMTGTPW